MTEGLKLPPDKRAEFIASGLAVIKEGVELQNLRSVAELTRLARSALASRVEVATLMVQEKFIAGTGDIASLYGYIAILTNEVADLKRQLANTQPEPTNG